MNTIPSRICFVAGKSGGHIVPCLTQIATLKESAHPYEILFFTTDLPLDKEIIEASGLVDAHVPLRFCGMHAKRWYSYFFIVASLIHSIIVSLWYVRRMRTEKIVSTGGYVALPVCIAAKIARIPIELMELNVIPGNAIRTLAPLATTVFICFKRTALYLPKAHTIVQPYPHRFLHARVTPEEIALLKQKHTFSQENKTMLILGGSQGSQFLNEAMAKIITEKMLATNNIQIIHQTGNASSSSVEALSTLYARHHIPSFVFGYTNAMAAIYNMADLVICRAGAGTLFETLFFNKHALIIPLELAHDAHQLANAQEMVIENQRLFTLLRQKQIEQDYQLLATAIEQLLHIPCDSQIIKPHTTIDIASESLRSTHSPVRS